MEKIECLEPIYFGYDLFKQKLFGKYKGKIIAWHKPSLQSKFGSKIICDDYSLLIKLPFNLKAIKIFLSKEKIYLN